MTGFQSGAFQPQGFQTPTATQQPQGGGGYGWGAYDHEAKRRKRRKELLEEAEQEELAREIAALEEHLAPVVETIRAKAHVYLPPRVKRAVAKAVRVETIEAFRDAEIALRKFERDEEEEFAVLLSLALH